MMAARFQGWAGPPAQRVVVTGLRLHESIRRPPPGARSGARDDEGPEEAPLTGIRCPLCAWQPRPSDQWGCSCGMAWNTFATRGRCPRCERQWLHTACLACHRWSRHIDWYVTPPARA